MPTETDAQRVIKAAHDKAGGWRPLARQLGAKTDKEQDNIAERLRKAATGDTSKPAHDLVDGARAFLARTEGPDGPAEPKAEYDVTSMYGPGGLNLHVQVRPDLWVTVRAAVKASAGLGYMIAEGDGDHVERWHVARQRIFDLIGVWLQPGDEAIYIAGWSMKRETGGLSDGQLVIYRPTEAIASGQRHVIEVSAVDYDSHEVLCKRVQRLAGGGLRLVSDNRGPSFPDELLRPEKDYLVHVETGVHVRVNVVGRVLWPKENDDEGQIRLSTEAIERMASAGLLTG